MTWATTQVDREVKSFLCGQEQVWQESLTRIVDAAKKQLKWQQYLRCYFFLPFLYLPTILLGLYETKSCMLHGSGSFFISSRTLSKDGRESWLLGVGFRMSGVARSLGSLWTEGTGSAERTATMGWDCSEDPFNVTTSGLDFVSCLGSGRVPSSELVFWTA